MNALVRVRYGVAVNVSGLSPLTRVPAEAS
jgi:hypothetical protein